MRNETVKLSPLFYRKIEGILEKRKELLLRLSEKDIILPTTEEIVEINRVIMLEHKGVFGVRDISLVDSSIASILHAREYGDESGLLALGYVLFSKIIKNHPFVDGNKRTAVVAFEYFLELNGETLELSNDQLYRLAVDIASGKDKPLYMESYIHPHGPKP